MSQLNLPVLRGATLNINSNYEDSQQQKKAF